MKKFAVLFISSILTGFIIAALWDQGSQPNKLNQGKVLSQARIPRQQETVSYITVEQARTIKADIINSDLLETVDSQSDEIMLTAINCNSKKFQMSIRHNHPSEWPN